MKIPSPEHPITLTANPKRVRVLYQDHLIADTGGALTLKEADYPPVQYIPRDDATMMFLARSDRKTHCPYKGEASYYNIVRDGVITENAVWSYEDPYPAMALIKDYLAFYPNQVEIEELDDPRNAQLIRDIVEHTDSGAGASQRESWPATVDGGPAQPDTP